MKENANRQDLAEAKRIELHLHTKMSAMDGLISPTDAVRMAKEWGHPAIAITDHHEVSAFPEAMWASEKYGVKVIYGVELAHKEENESEFEGYHQTILVKNQTGLKNLYRLLSKNDPTCERNGHLTYSKAELEVCREGLLFGSACRHGELFSALSTDATEEELDAIVRRYDYLEVQPVCCSLSYLAVGLLDSEEDIRSINRRIVALGERYGKPVVATGDTHYTDPEEEICYKILKSERYAEDELEKGRYLRTTEEMLEEFSYLGAEKAYELVVENTNRIADQIEPVFPIPKGTYLPHVDGAEELIRAICEDRVNALYGANPPESVRARLDKELSFVFRNGWESLFMIAKRIVDQSENCGYHVGTRGLAGSSFVAYLLGITDINPLDYNLPCESFYGFAGERVPDIDLNISPRAKTAILSSLESSLGKDKLFLAGTIGTLSEKTAYGYIQRYCERNALTPTRDDVAQWISTCAGVKRSSGSHPGGIVVVPKEYDVFDFTPIRYFPDGSDAGITHFSFMDLYDTLMKIDVLMHTVPTRYRLLETSTGVAIGDVPLEDPKVLALFTRGDTEVHT